MSFDGLGGGFPDIAGSIKDALEGLFDGGSLGEGSLGEGSLGGDDAENEIPDVDATRAKDESEDDSEGFDLGGSLGDFDFGGLFGGSLGGSLGNEVETEQ